MNNTINTSCTAASNYLNAPMQSTLPVIKNSQFQKNLDTCSNIEYIFAEGQRARLSGKFLSDRSCVYAEPLSETILSKSSLMSFVSKMKQSGDQVTIESFWQFLADNNLSKNSFKTMFTDAESLCPVDGQSNFCSGVDKYTKPDHQEIVNGLIHESVKDAKSAQKLRGLLCEEAIEKYITYAMCEFQAEMSPSNCAGSFPA